MRKTVLCPLVLSRASSQSAKLSTTHYNRTLVRVEITVRAGGVTTELLAEDRALLGWTFMLISEKGPSLLCGRSAPQLFAFISLVLKCCLPPFSSLPTHCLKIPKTGANRQLPKCQIGRIRGMAISLTHPCGDLVQMAVGNAGWQPPSYVQVKCGTGWIHKWSSSFVPCGLFLFSTFVFI